MGSMGARWGAGGPLTVNQAFHFIVPSPQVGLVVCGQRPGGEGATPAAADTTGTSVLFALPLLPRRASEALWLAGCWHVLTGPVRGARLALTLASFFRGATLTPVGRCPAWGGKSADFGRPRERRRPGGSCPQGARDCSPERVERHGYAHATLHTTAGWRCSVAHEMMNLGWNHAPCSAETTLRSPQLIIRILQLCWLETQWSDLG